MGTRKVTLTIPESLAARLDAYPGRLKLSAFLQEKLAAFLDSEEAKAVALMDERQSLSNRVHEMVMNGEHGSSYIGGRNQGESWAVSLSAEEMISTRTRLSLNPYPVELGRPSLLPKSLLEDDPCLKLYAKTMLGPELTQAFSTGPEPVFMLSANKKDEALVWISGWNEGVEDAYRDMCDAGMMIDETLASTPPRTRQKRRPKKKEKR